MGSILPPIEQEGSEENFEIKPEEGSEAEEAEVSASVDGEDK